MNITFEPDFPVTDDACKEATGKTITEWAEWIDANGLAGKRRDAINQIYDLTGRGKDVWWPTTIWVEYERMRGVVNKKDGRGDGFHLCCTKGLKLPPDQVYPHFATEEAINKWVEGWSGKIEEGAAFEVAGCTGTIGRIRPDKDIRMIWQSPGFEPSEIEIQFTKAGEKTTVNINHKRIQTRAEADGLRRAWGEALDRLKLLLA